MKRIYTENYVERRPAARRASAHGQRSRKPAGKQAREPERRTTRRPARRRGLNARNPRVWLLGVALALVFILFVSVLLAAADASIGPAYARTVHQFKAPAGSKAAAPGVWANAAVLTDGESGRVLYEKNAHEKLPIASTTKMMTALVVRNKTKLTDKVVVTPEAANVGEESINLVPGETLTVEQLLNVMLIQSANDAAYALAQHTGGTIAGFAELMNKEAAAIGAKDSHFTNPHGLDQSGHYSSAYDLAVIGRALMHDPVLAKIVSTPKYSIPTPNQPWNRVAVGHNEILTQYPGANGIKTGYTARAGFCLAASASRDNKALIAVVLNSTHRADDVSALFNYGFASTARIVLVNQGQKLGTSRVSSFPKRYVTALPSAGMAVLTFKGSNDVFKVTTLVQRKSPSPVKAGQSIGKIDVALNNAPFESEPAVADRSESKSNFLGAAGAFCWYSLCWTGKILSAPFRIF